MILRPYIWLSLIVTCISFTLCCNGYTTNSSSTLMEAIEEQEHKDVNDKTRSLSRRKRYLIFVKGSSLQLVFCLTYPMNITIGDIFLMGVTTAMAWQLPQEPYVPYQHNIKSEPTITRNDDSLKLYYENEKPIRKLEVNPVFTKRSLPNISISSDHLENCHDPKKDRLNFDRKYMHEGQKDREFLNEAHMSYGSSEFHRNSRKGLYNKVEKLLGALGHDGRQCVLKTLCQIGQNKHEEQGTFLDEIVRAIFTLPTGTEFDKELHQEYDRAHGAQEDCELLYPKCKSSMKDIPFR